MHVKLVPTRANLTSCCLHPQSDLAQAYFSLMNSSWVEYKQILWSLLNLFLLWATFALKKPDISACF